MKQGKENSQVMEVCLDAAEWGPIVVAGRLFHRRTRAHSALSFAYSEEWLTDDRAFALDPRLDLSPGEQFAASETASFGIFLDSSPDRWGRVLLERRETLLARTERRVARSLSEWDYLLGVHDETRMGALRFRREAGAPFLDDSTLSVAPVTTLRIPAMTDS